MDRRDLLTSILADELIASSMVPWACPADFGPNGRYQLQELVGVGRQSLVYRAHDRLLSSEGYQAAVAVKIRQSAGVAREAMTARRVVHDNVLRVFDRGVDPDSGAQYLVMEYVDGGDLSKVKVPWDVRGAVRCMAKVARGVQAAHSAGVVHCDLKPANILLTGGGEPKVSDFDLASSVVSQGAESRGNYAFMSPEQFAGDPNALSPPSDVYALGGLLFYLLTGSLPNGGTHAEVEAGHLPGAASRRELLKGDLAKVVGRALARERSVRYDTAGELASDLERWLKLEPIPWLRTNPVRRSWMWSRRKPLHAVGVAVVVGLLAGGVTLKLYLEGKELERDRQAQAEAKRLFEQERQAAGDDVVRFATQSYAATVGKPGSDRSDRMLPMLVLLEMIGGTSVLNESHRVALAGERITQLRTEIASLEEQGRGEQLTALLMRYGLAYFLVSEGRGQEALLVLPEIEQLLLPKLQPQDPVHAGVSAIRLCAEALTHPEELAKADIAALKERGHVLYQRKDNEPVRRLIQRVVARLDQRTKAKP
jgi:serine/threonine-protein kinase